MDLEIKAMVKELCTQCQNPDNQRQLHDHYTHGNGQQNHGACYLCEIVPLEQCILQNHTPALKMCVDHVMLHSTCFKLFEKFSDCLVSKQ